MMIDRSSGPKAGARYTQCILMSIWTMVRLIEYADMRIRDISWAWFRECVSDRYQFITYINAVFHREMIQC